MATKVRIKIEAFDHNILIKSFDLLKRSISELDVKMIGPISLPTKIKRYCVLRSPHVDKKSREHLEIRTYKKFIDIHNLSNDNLQALLNENYPAGIKITVF